MTFSELHTKIGNSISISSYDVKIIMAIVFSVVMLSMVYLSYGSLVNKKKAMQSGVNEGGGISGQIVLIAFFVLMFFVNIWAFFFHPWLIPG